MLTKVLKSLFSVKVPIESIKKLREQTSAPMGECKKALEQSDGDHQQAIQWLKLKGLSSAEKHSKRQTRQGVVASFLTPCKTKALLLQVNCQTDFVAKNDLFLRFVDGLGNRLLEAEEQVNIQGVSNEESQSRFSQILQKIEPMNIFPEDTSTKNIGEELKIVISRLQQNVRIRRAITFHSDNCRYGSYVHMPYSPNIGLEACVVQVQTEEPVEQQQHLDSINQFANDIAIQILGNPPKYLNFTEIPQQIIEAQTQKVQQQVAGILAKAPEHMHQKIVSGKLLSNFYSQTLLGCMPYVLSNEGAQVSEYWSSTEEQIGTNISITHAVSWTCK